MDLFKIVVIVNDNLLTKCSENLIKSFFNIYFLNVMCEILF